ncbi:DUF4913 domain-containing protein [Streptomyces sp. Ru73]|uniref:DUF4913 domain-containing protein n=1 Tax=Streptomyces sp. Ru73 TaxID=2080748 RepID=UPI000CDCED3F|nr:DUF4913 domain-containing protein [Streptomyces sp. Ru73]POX43057.1 DUF4913 domain-containing protein [Streptomyces sp. Ru73]
MSGTAENDGPVRIPDHDVDDLVATVSALVAKSQQQAETLARLTDEQLAPEDEPREATSTSAKEDGFQGPSSSFILTLEGRAYATELAALATWVDDLLLPVYGREITASRPWCHRWTEHPEAVARLHALWLAWQQYTDTEAGLAGPSTWHRDHLDPALLQLRAPDGPFGACTTSRTRPNHRLLPGPETAANRS